MRWLRRYVNDGKDMFFLCPCFITWNEVDVVKAEELTFHVFILKPIYMTENIEQKVKEISKSIQSPGISSVHKNIFFINFNNSSVSILLFNNN